MILRKTRNWCALGMAFILVLTLSPKNIFAENGDFIFSLQGYLQQQEVGQAFNFGPRLQGAGGPDFTVTSINSNVYLQISERTANWNALDINRYGLYLGDIITITGFADNPPEGTQMVLGGAESPWNWADSAEVTPESPAFTMHLELTAAHFEDEQFIRFRVQTNDEGAEMTFYISDITIERPADASPHAWIETPQETQTAIPEGEQTLLYALSADSYVLVDGTTNLEASAYLELSGEADVIRINGSLYITNRSENWHTVDVTFEPLGLLPGGTYLFIAAGTAHDAPGGAQIGWHRTQAPWNFIPGTLSPISDDQWEISGLLTGAALADALSTMDGLRIQTNNAEMMDFNIHSIYVYQIGEVDMDIVLEQPTWDMELPSLAQQFAPFFLLGNIYPTTAIMDQFYTRDAFLHHFNAVTAENWHKPSEIAPAGFDIPTADQFNFAQADAIVDWAMANDITLVGHAFVWHNQTPNWLFWESEGVPHTRAQARENMHFYISTLSNHFAQRGVLGAFYSWDVANEVIASGGGTWYGDTDNWDSGDWRTQLRENSPWLLAYANDYNPAAGEHPSDFVYDAFVFARRYFPYSILYYNDYNEEIPAKRNAIAQMVEQLNQRWAHDIENNPQAVPVGEEYTGRLLIEAIGMQSHFHYPMGGWATNFDNIRPAIERFAATGAALSITELDITVGAHGAGATAFDELPQEYALRQAQIYGRIFEYYLEFYRYIQRVSIWGLADNQSWRAPGHPLIFDASFAQKPAFYAILEAVENAPAPVVYVPVFTTASLPSATIGHSFIYRLNMERGNLSPVRFTAQGLPNGLVLHSTTGVIEGTPTQSGSFEITVQASNASHIAESAFTLDIAPQDEDLVAIRQFAETLGLTVEWYEPTQTVTIISDQVPISFVAEIIIDDRVFVPRYFAEQLF